MAEELRFDALLPPEMARRAEYLGERKASMAFIPMFMLAVLAGAFISLGAVFSTTVASGSFSVSDATGAKAFTVGLPYGVTRLLSGLAFSLGLIMVVVGGAELFTGNTLIVMAWARGKVTSLGLLRNWCIVYLGNLVGSLGTALLVFLSGQYNFGSNAVGATALSIANSKSGLEWGPALMLGILCNALVCLAVWMTFSARTATDKILACFLPVAAFVAAGFEHSIANMYFIPYGLMIKEWDPVTTAAITQNPAVKVDHLTLSNMLLNNLLPVTIGNIIGGGVLVAGVYYLVFLRNAEK